MPEDKADIENKINKLVKELKTHIDSRSFAIREINDLIFKIGSLRSWHIIEPLKNIIKEPRCPNNIKIKVLEELGKYGEPRVIGILSEYIKNKDKSIRNAAVKGLSTIKNIKCVQPLLDSIDDEEKWVRIFAINGLKKNENKKVVKPIIERLGDEETQVREEAMGALKRINPEFVIDELIGALQSSNRFVKRGAASILGDRHINKASKNLIKMLNGDDRGTSLIASRALSKIADPNTIPELLIQSLKEGGIDSIHATSIYNMGQRNIVNPLIQLYKVTDEGGIRDLIVQLLQKTEEGVAEEIIRQSEMETDPENKKILDNLYNKL